MQAIAEYGTVISDFEGPSTKNFKFLLSPKAAVRKGQFVQINTDDGKLISRVAEILKTNRYYMRPESVKEYQSSGKTMDEIFPVTEWEYLVADAVPLGLVSQEGRCRECSFPPSPGMKVTEPEKELLSRFFGFDQKGVHLGTLRRHSNEVRLNLTRLLQKHMAILAISGAGKSYLTSVLIEELLSRKPEEGQVAVVLLDTHGEYVTLGDDPAFSSKVKVIPSSDYRIGFSAISPYSLSKYMRDPSEAQERELAKAMDALRQGNKNFGLKELMDYVEASEGMPQKTKDILLSCLSELGGLRIFGHQDYPSPADVAEQGSLCVLDLSEEINMRKKRIMADHLARGLFDSRRAGKVPPFLLVVEEAHQFAPEKEKDVISKGIINTIAREGRKFHASLCLISQRPVQLSTTALSQCNTQIILRVTNPYDLKHIGESSEGITADVQGQISSLQVGTGLVVGEAVSFPLFVDIKERKSRGGSRGMPLEKAAVEYHAASQKRKADAKSFM